MSEQTTLFVLGTLLALIGALTMLLLGWIVWELRQLRKDLAGCVPDRYCRALMSAHERRIENIEKSKGK